MRAIKTCHKRKMYKKNGEKTYNEETTTKINRTRAHAQHHADGITYNGAAE